MFTATPCLTRFGTGSIWPTCVTALQAPYRQGKKRRVGLARLGVINRKVLFLDEPTVSLDGFSVKLFSNFIRDQHLANGGIAVIATHIDLGLDEATTLDLTPFAAADFGPSDSDEAFL